MVVLIFSGKNICQETMRIFIYVSTVLYDYMKSLWNGVKKTLISNSARTTHSEITVIVFAQHRKITNLFDNTQVRIQIYRAQREQAPSTMLKYC
jgi:hypothetical protein